MLNKFNNLSSGLIVGTLLPAVLYYFLIMPKMRHFSFIGNYYGEMILKMLPLFLSRCIFPNALLFFALLWLNLVHAAKGVLISTAVLTAVLLLISYIF
jgi:hypothetical protein